MGEREPAFRRLPLSEALRPAGSAPAHLSLRGPRGTLAESVCLAGTPWKRMRGLLGVRELQPGEGLVIAPCRRVHTFGMRMAIDAVFCDRGLNVVGFETLGPGRVSRRWPEAQLCIELAAGAAEQAGLKQGDHLEISSPPDEE